MDTERYQALMDAVNLVVDCMVKTDTRDPFLFMGNVYEHLNDEIDTMLAEEVSA